MAKEILSDELWGALEPLLPEPPPRPQGGRRRAPNRAALTGIFFVLKSGIPWELLPPELGCGSGMTYWRRRDWHARGVWQAFHHALLDCLGAADQIDWTRAALDSATVPAPGGQATGPNPTDHGQSGTKRPVVVDWRLRVRYERRADMHLVFLRLGCVLICWNYMVNTFC